ncbi:hypothetical protein [Streptomyces sp. NPDC004230]
MTEKTEPATVTRARHRHPRRRAMRAAFAFTAAAAMALSLAACHLEPGPAGTVVDKSKRLSCQRVGSTQQCRWKFRLTTRDTSGNDHTFKVTRADYNACYRNSSYPHCTEVR